MQNSAVLIDSANGVSLLLTKDTRMQRIKTRGLSRAGPLVSFVYRGSRLLAGRLLISLGSDGFS
jgi:hypothetical protein